MENSNKFIEVKDKLVGSILINISTIENIYYDGLMTVYYQLDNGTTKDEVFEFRDDAKQRYNYLCNILSI